MPTPTTFGQTVPAQGRHGAHTAPPGPKVDESVGPTLGPQEVQAFANIVIADEINRASPKTQSALLEVMEERHVTVDGVGHPVPRPFLVVATQNPVEMDGTYRLPEAQLDRFLMKLSLGYPDEAVEIEVLRGAAVGRSPDSLEPLTDTTTIAQAISLARRLHLPYPLHT